jgi:hypothetical protein
VPIVAIPDWWWYTAWYDMLGLSAVASAADGFYLAGYLLYQAKEAGRNRVLAAGARRAPPLRPGPSSPGAADSRRATNELTT